MQVTCTIKPCICGVSRIETCLSAGVRFYPGHIYTGLGSGSQNKQLATMTSELERLCMLQRVMAEQNFFLGGVSIFNLYLIYKQLHV